MPVSLATACRVLASRQSNEASNLALERPAGSPSLAAAAQRGVRRTCGGLDIGTAAVIAGVGERDPSPIIVNNAGSEAKWVAVLAECLRDLASSRGDSRPPKPGTAGVAARGGGFP